ncbi:serine hydrolase domain-containing protein [Hymenobacter weizhouensis]|uniref:serine hydrolase domain-containing protein n=1 Tax=Hymenobacter sp. YIM 151500-1 TaxID=2987689 RepID=UPI002225D0C0|nr:serine hydrolase domain-containing protein [Hymenobacter sp. YIM 151500-1]UYZ64694.1 beta-lactamase family protein [Hymenobacter sp. YIM 151500-1]
MRILLLVLVLLCSLPSRAQQTELADLLRQKHVPGIQLIYTKSGKSTAYVLGSRHNGAAAAVDAHTTFQAASLGKVVLAYTALRLHDQGLLALDKPLLSYHNYPRLRTQPQAGRITARLVLTHTSGLPNWAENPLGSGWSTSELRLRFPPDSCWNYSGEGFVLLQQTLEHLTGKSWEALAQQEVFGPLGMRGSSFEWQARFAQNASFGHDKTGKPTEIRRFTPANAGFTLLTTAADYSRFVQALLMGTGLSAASRALLTTPLTAADRCRRPTRPTDPFIAWAAGVGLATTSRGPALWHWGDNGDFQGFFMAFPATQESVVFFTNSANGLQLTDDVLRLFFGPGQYRAMQWLAEDN